MVKWEELITLITVLCAVSAIGSGVVWLAVKREFLLFLMLGLSALYLIGRQYWKFRDEFPMRRGNPIDRKEEENMLGMDTKGRGSKEEKKIYGGRLKMGYDRMRPEKYGMVFCPDCHGNGRGEDGESPCQKCSGFGWLIESEHGYPTSHRQSSGRRGKSLPL